MTSRAQDSNDADAGHHVALIDLHCHTSASFDGIADPAAVVARAAERGLTHVVITDHDTLDGALRAVDAAPAGLTVIVGCEVNTREGDLVFAFVGQPLPRDVSAREAIEAGRAQGALVGIPHPYDTTRRSLLLDPAHEELVRLVDWVEAWNGRVGRRAANDQAAALARRAGLPGVGVSDAHTLLEVGTVSTSMNGDLSTPTGLRDALRAEPRILGADPELRPGSLARILRVGARRKP